MRRQPANVQGSQQVSQSRSVKKTSSMPSPNRRPTISTRLLEASPRCSRATGGAHQCSRREAFSSGRSQQKRPSREPRPARPDATNTSKAAARQSQACQVVRAIVFGACRVAPAHHLWTSLALPHRPIMGRRSKRTPGRRSEEVGRGSQSAGPIIE